MPVLKDGNGYLLIGKFTRVCIIVMLQTYIDYIHVYRFDSDDARATTAFGQSIVILSHTDACGHISYLSIMSVMNSILSTVHARILSVWPSVLRVAVTCYYSANRLMYGRLLMNTL